MQSEIQMTGTRPANARPAFCASCGACVLLSANPSAHMAPGRDGPRPVVDNPGDGPLDRSACPGAGIDYPRLYRAHYGTTPPSWLTGIVCKVRTGHASDPDIRLAGASGGVITRVLQYLLETGRVDGVVAAKQGVPSPMEASAVIATTPREVLECAGSVYIQVPMIPALDAFEPGKRYAFVGTPEQTAALRELQRLGDERAKQVEFVLGPYTGTALSPGALEYYLRSNKIAKDDHVTSVKWRAGKWPGHLEIATESGRVLRSPKVYYNFLIPFFITDTSLLSRDFCNEFADLAVGDAWSPKFENAGEGGVSVVVTRTAGMEEIVAEMCRKGLLALDETDPAKAGDMHGHMLDFKKRGGYLRGRMRRFFGRPAPDYGYRPAGIAFSRRAVELVISAVFFVCRTAPARWLACRVPERILGPFFNWMRLRWKALSRPTKRKGLAQYDVAITEGDGA